MGRPKGSKNIPRETIPPLEPVRSCVLITGIENGSEEEKPDLVLTVRRIRIGSFQGLWELCKIMPDGSAKVLTDANTKGIVANLAYNEISKCGT